MSLTDPYLRHEAQDSEGSAECDHDRIERIHIHGRGPFAIYRWHCPDCGLRETEAWEP